MSSFTHVKSEGSETSSVLTSVSSHPAWAGWRGSSPLSRVSPTVAPRTTRSCPVLDAVSAASARLRLRRTYSSRKSKANQNENQGL